MNTEVDLTDEETADEEPPATRGVTLSEFQAMSHDAKMQFIRSGAALVDDPEVTEIEKKKPQTVAERVASELAALRDAGVVKKTIPAITRETLHQLSPAEQSEFFRAGGKLVESPAPEKKPLPKDAMTASRFIHELSHDEKMEFIKSGKSLVDEAEYLPSGTKSSTVTTRSAFREMTLREQVAFLDAGGTVTD